MREVCGKWRGGKYWNFGKIEILWLREEGRENREKEKKKEN